jgi:hypothetical protein
MCVVAALIPPGGLKTLKTLSRPRDAADIVRRLRSVRPESVARWGRMSAHQMVCHVADAMRMALGERPVRAATGLRQRTLLKWTVLYLPLPWPAGIVTRPEIDQEAGGTKPADFAGDVAQAEALLELVVMPRRTTWPAHPIFGPMSHEAWLRWAYLHTDHHLRQFGA